MHLLIIKKRYSTAMPKLNFIPPLNNYTSKKATYTIQSTTRIKDFFVVGIMSGILVGFVILVGQIK